MRALCIAWLLATAPAWGAPAIVQVTPEQVPFGHAATVNITVDGLSPDAQFALAPGGPFLARDIALPDARAVFAPPQSARLIVVGAHDVHVWPTPDDPAESSAPIVIDAAIEQAEFDTEFGVLVDAGGTAHAITIDAAHRPRISSVATLPAPVRDLAVSGSLAFALLDDGRVLRADLATGVLVWTDLGGVDAAVDHLAADGAYCYFSGLDTGLLIARCDGETLAETARFRTAGDAHDVAVQGSIAFVADGATGLTLVDIADRERPRLLGANNRIGDVRAIALDAERVYAWNTRGELHLLDVARPTLPLALTRLHAGAPARRFAARDDHVWIAAETALRDYDFSADAAPLLSDEGLNLGGSRRGFVQGNTLYVADWFSGLHIYDIADPRAPRHVGNYHSPGSAKGVVVRDHYAFVADDDHGVQVVDVSNPAQAVAVHTIPTAGLAYTMKLVDERLYLADHRGGFAIIDVSDPKTARVIGRYDTPGKAWAIDVRDHIAYVADDQSGLLIFDVANPARIELLGQYTPGGQAEDVRLHQGYAFVTFFDSGLHVVDVGDPRAPRAQAQLDIPGNARGIDFQGHYAYVAAWEAGLQVVDIRDPRRPRLAGYVDTDGAAWGVNLSGQHAWVLDWWGGVKSIDIRNPHRPLLAARYHTRAPVADLAASDHFVVTVGGTAGAQIYDTTNPLNPVWVNGVEIPGDARSVALDGATAYVATSQGLGVIDVRDPFTARARRVVASPHVLTTVRAAAGVVAGLTTNATAGLVDIVTGDLRPVAAGVQDLWLTADALFVARGALGLAAYTLDGKPATLSTRWLGPVTALRLLRVATERAVVVDGPDRIRVLSRRELDLRERGQLNLPAPIRAIDLDAHTLYATTEQNVLYEIDLSDPAQPRILMEYPSAQPLFRIAARGRAVFVGGDLRLASLKRLPGVAFRRQDATTVTAALPDTLPLGSYDLVVRDGAHPPLRRHNALRVTLKTGKKPALSPEQFNELLQQHRGR